MLKIKNIIGLLLIIFFLGSFSYHVIYLPHKYKNNFIETLKKDDIKVAYIYDYLPFGNDFSAFDNKDQNTYNLLKRLKGIAPEETYFVKIGKIMEIDKIISIKKIESSKIKEMTSYLGNLGTTSKGESINKPFLLKVVFSKKELWLQFGKGGHMKNNRFIVNFTIDIKDSIDFKGYKYLWGNYSSQGDFRAPELEKFFEQFHLEKWREENRKKLKNGAN